MLCQLHEKVPRSSSNLRWWQRLSEPDTGWDCWELMLFSPLLLPSCLPFSSDNRSWRLKEALVSHSSRSLRSELVCGEGYFLVLQSDFPYVLSGYFSYKDTNAIMEPHPHDPLPCLLSNTLSFRSESSGLTSATHILKLERKQRRLAVSFQHKNLVHSGLWYRPSPHLSSTCGELLLTPQAHVSSPSGCQGPQGTRKGLLRPHLLLSDTAEGLMGTARPREAPSGRLK